MSQDEREALPVQQKQNFEENLMADYAANNLQKMICFYINRNTKSLIPNAIIPMLKVLSESTLDKSELNDEFYKQIEDKVM